MSSIKGNRSEIIDSVARNILNSENIDEKEKFLESFKDIAKKEIIKTKEAFYRRCFTGLVIAIYLTTNVLIGYVILKAFHLDIYYIKSSEIKIDRLIDGKVIIALITGVVIQTAASFGILTKYVYEQKKDTKIIHPDS